MDYHNKFEENKDEDLSLLKSSNINKDIIQDILDYIFKNGKIPNNRWWKIPTILKNTGIFTDDEIINMIKESIGDTNDIKNKLKYASRWKHNFSIGTLVYYAKENGYHLPDSIKLSSKKLKFWEINNNNQNKIIASISYNCLNKLLINNGFRRMELDKGFILIKVKDLKQVEKIQESQIKEFVFEYLDNNTSLFNSFNEKSAVEECLRRNHSSIFFSIITNLKSFNNELNSFAKDSNDTSYLFYNNGFVEIKEDGVSLTEYSELKNYIWKKSIINREFHKTDEKSEYQLFIERICTNRNIYGSLTFNAKKYESMLSSIGYLLHRYKNPSLTKGIVLCDEAISDAPNGGTGKSIFAKALGKIRNCTTLDSRLFIFDSPFRFGTVTNSTEIINFDDCSPKFQFEKLFNVITSDLTVECKGMNRFTIPFERSPKLVFSTNHIFRGDGNSHERRIFEIEFSNYFGKEYKPKDEFNHLLFDDWDENEYNKFDNFMASCIQFYLKKGLVFYEQVNLSFKKLAENTSSEIAQYLVNYLKEDVIYTKESVLADLKDCFSLDISQTKLTQSLNYYSNTYLESSIIEFRDSNIKKNVFVITKDNSKNQKYWKKSNQFNKLKENIIEVPSLMYSNTE